WGLAGGLAEVMLLACHRPIFLALTLLDQGNILHSPGDEIDYVYFPLDCLLSITITMQNGDTAETGLIGNREVIGINALMQYRSTTLTTYVAQTPGQAVKIEASLIREEFNGSCDVRDIFLRYIQAFIAQVSQTTACNRLHNLEQRFARWLLEARDRTQSERLQLTQEVIADMLGVRRAGVSQAAQKFQELAAIRYQRGRIQILSDKLLIQHACECFECVKDEYDRLLGVRGSPFPNSPT
ncbi:hypothetical protein C7271_21435, partial [filamentous cyanobacterium CCP5]